MTRAPYLVINDHHSHSYRLTWYLPEENDLGGNLGDLTYETESEKAEDPDGARAYAAVAAIEGVARDRDGFLFDRRSDAAAALRIAKAAIKAGGRPMPDWATKAIAAGWKAPRGWKP